jgi:tetratricopeptide (TPR) repeat protein
MGENLVNPLAALRDAFHAWQHLPDDSHAKALALAADQAHQAFIEAFRAGNFVLAKRFIDSMQVLAARFYSADPINLWRLYSDHATLMFELGDYHRAADLFQQALKVATVSEGHAGTCTLQTLASFIDAAQAAGDDIRVNAQLTQAETALLDMHIDGLTRLKLAAATATVMMARGRASDAERLLRNFPIQSIASALRATEASRHWTLLAHSYASRDLYADAFKAHRQALAIIKRCPNHWHARADAMCALAQSYRMCASEQIFSRHWWYSRMFFLKALHLRRHAESPLPGAGWKELSALALMALHEGRASRARALHRDAVRSASRVLQTRSSAMQDLLLGRVVIDMAVCNFEGAHRRLNRVCATLRALGTSASVSLTTARMLQAELYRRTGQNRKAALLLGHLALRDTGGFAASVRATWSAYDTGRGRQVLPVHAFADAVLSEAMINRAGRARLFHVLAYTQDIALRTLRQRRGAATAQFKTAPTVRHIARALPADGVFVQFFRRIRRMEGPDGAQWKSQHAAYIALVVHAGIEDVVCISLGPADALDQAVAAMLHQMETGPVFDRTALHVLQEALRPHLGWVRYAFFAPDGALHAFPFAMLMCLPSSPGCGQVAIMVESAARLLETRRDEETLRSFRRPCVIGAPECGQPNFPYEELPGVRREAELIAHLLNVTPVVLPRTLGAKPALEAALRGGNDMIHLCGHADVFRAEDKTHPHGPLNKDQLTLLLSTVDVFDQARIILGGFNDWIAGDSAVSSPDAASVTATELAAMKLTGVRLLTLSICRGAQGMERPLEAPASLATAARFAGVGVVVAALWSVSDYATTLLMRLLYRYLNAHGSTALALALAQARMAKCGFPPSEWAAFVVWADIGDLPV